mmetsp:Transcript_60981/g.89424  ORF Transcript_60981/g.89424 Transcript_60981/m.89424 type:complete len:205 (-) Transcript_60981:248-862(-)
MQTEGDKQFKSRAEWQQSKNRSSNRRKKRRRTEQLALGYIQPANKAAVTELKQANKNARMRAMQAGAPEPAAHAVPAPRPVLARLLPVLAPLVLAQGAAGLVLSGGAACASADAPDRPEAPLHTRLLAMQTEMDLLKKDKQDSSELAQLANECCICLDAEKTMVFVPCGHKAACEACAGTIMQSSNKICPMCRLAVDVVVKMYA